MDLFAPRNLNRWWLPGLAALLCLLLLVAAIPYANGYQFHRESILMRLLEMWDVKRPLIQLWNPGYFSKPVEGNEHGVLVPLICGVMVWVRREELAKVPIRGSTRLGLAVLLLGAAIFWVGMRMERQQVGFVALQVLTAGLILWLWGKEFFKEVLAIWAFLIFAWPVADQLGDFVGYPLRVAMSHMAAAMLNLVGVPTVLNGTGLYSAPSATAAMGSEFQIGIADACSGIRSLYALMMISTLYGYFALTKTWQKWIVFLCAFPIAVAGNVVRIMMLTLGAIHFGTPFAIGTEEKPSTYHMWSGFAVFLVAFGLLALIGNLLESKMVARLLQRVNDWLQTPDTPPPTTKIARAPSRDY